MAWTLVLVSSYEGTVWRERILGTYEHQMGAPIQQIEYFEVYACVRRLFSVVASIHGGADKLGMNPNAVALMKEQKYAHRRVYDLLLERTGIRVSEVEKLFGALS